MLKFTSIYSYEMHQRNGHWIKAIKEEPELITGITNRAIEKSSEEKNVFTRMASHK